MAKASGWGSEDRGFKSRRPDMKKLTSDVTVELHVPDFEIAIKFYNDLGFEVVWERKKGDPSARFLVMRKGESILNFFGGDETVYEQHYFKRFPRSTPRGYQVEITIPIDGLKEFYDDIKEKYKNSIVRPLGEKTFRARKRQDFRIVDPFGFYLCFVERYNWVDGRDKQGNPLK